MLRSECYEENGSVGSGAEKVEAAEIGAGEVGSGSSYRFIFVINAKTKKKFFGAAI